MQADELLRQGKLGDSLAKLQEQVREDPSSAKKRIFLFQLLSVMGQWERAMTQLNVAAELDAGALLMAQVCRAGLNAEALRAEIFAGKRLPLVFGQPSEWVGWMVQANQLSATGREEAARDLRERAAEAAPAVAGAIDGRPFDWIADADPRLGPILEAVIDGRYFWVPLQNVQRIKVEKPTDLRDLVWTPVTFTWNNGGAAVGLIPTRYPGSESSPDDAIRMARKTEWAERPGGLYVGAGQRTFATDAGEYAILETRNITLGIDASAGDESATK